MDIDGKGIEKQNQFIKIFTGGTGHSRRLLTNNDIYKISGVEVHVPIMKQPICEHCERVVMWDWTRDRFGREIPLAVCTHCGTITKNPMTFGEYIANGHDIPETVRGIEREQAIVGRRMLNAMFNMKGRGTV